MDACTAMEYWRSSCFQVEGHVVGCRTKLACMTSLHVDAGAFEACASSRQVPGGAASAEAHGKATPV